MGGNKTTSKSLALGAALREARIDAGHEQLTKFAELLGKPAPTLSRWETGQRTPRPEDVAQILTMLGITGERFDDILALTRNPDATSWLAISLPEQRLHLEALLRFEREARKVIAVAPLIVPGWLQTADYARAIMTKGGAPANEIESRITIRIGRREVLRNAELEVYIGQAALVQRIGGSDVLRGQLEYLLEMSEKMDLRVIPFTRDWHPGLEGPVKLIESVQGKTVVYLENRRSGLFLHEDPDIMAYRDAIGALRVVAVGPSDSKRLIAQEINQLKKENRHDCPRWLEEGDS
ncbi:Helix-turn-helix domain-containing protein [Kibdelosporangium aridum]|uniref:Helix-turn-helix domain-containing protein n=2 Tax=Kibdelosporangium aridum TaxID=2030 RepID=A0A1W2AS73_KIBAR|nr:Helix-turn-helix domain-containing protein [Kibdelosporangium aridum]